MRMFLLRHVLGLVGVVLGAALLLSMLLDLIPNAPAAADMPGWLRFLALMAGLVTGDFGISASQNAPVGTLIAERLAVTLPLALLSLIIAKAVGFGLGLLAARSAVADRALGGLARLFALQPPFWLGMLLVLGLALTLKLLPAGGFVPWSSPVAALTSLLLPALALGLPHAGETGLGVRRDFERGLDATAILAQRAAGRTAKGARWTLGLGAAIRALPRRLGRQVISILAGAALVENVFYLPGLGRQILGAVAQHDLVLLRGSLFVLIVIGAVAMVLASLGRLLDDRRVAE